MSGTGGAESASRQPEMRDSWGVPGLEKLMEQSGVERDPSTQEGKRRGRERKRNHSPASYSFGLLSVTRSNLLKCLPIPAWSPPKD